MLAEQFLGCVESLPPHPSCHMQEPELNSIQSSKEEEEKPESRRPKGMRLLFGRALNRWLIYYLIDGAFRQQRLPAWQPVMTPRVVLPTFFIVGILFLPIGGLLYWSSGRVSKERIMANFATRTMAN